MEEDQGARLKAVTTVLSVQQNYVNVMEEDEGARLKDVTTVQRVQQHFV
jgi:hypothetical protein